MEDQIQREEHTNKEKNRKIEILKIEFEKINRQHNDYKEATVKQMKDLETKYFTEDHTRQILHGEKQVWYDKVSNLKNVNQNMGRAITKDKYHNNRDEVDKERRRIIDEIQADINKLCEEVETLQAQWEEEQERNNDPSLLKRQKETTMNLKQDHNKILTDITVAENRIKDLVTRQEILNSSIADILKDKRKIDKYNMELEDKISGRNVTDEMTKKRHKNEERKMRIKYEKNVAYLKHQGVIFMEKIANEEAKSKEVLDEKLKLEQELLDLKEDLQKIVEKNAFNREELIKNKVKNSQLDSQGIQLTEEHAMLTKHNDELLVNNKAAEEENKMLKEKIATTIQRIDINNLLKEIDIEELQLLAKNNKTMNFAVENLITKWNFITSKNEAAAKKWW